METYKRHVITEKGLAFLAKQQAGNGLPNVSRVAAGAGTVPEEDLVRQTEISSWIADMEVGERSLVDGKVAKLPVRLGNTELKETALIQQIGVYAKDPDEGEILYQIVQFSLPQPLPSLEANRGAVAWFAADIDVMFANAENAEFPSSAGWFVSQEEFEDWKGKLDLRLEGYCTKAALEVLLEGYYTKEETDEVLEGKADKGTPEKNDLELASGYIVAVVAGSDYECVFYKSTDNKVTVELSVARANNSAFGTSLQIVAELPEGFRPSAVKHDMGYGVSGGDVYTPVSIHIRTDGTVRIRDIGGTAIRAFGEISYYVS